jgi:hypothetical protein
VMELVIGFAPLVDGIRCPHEESRFVTFTAY